MGTYVHTIRYHAATIHRPRGGDADARLHAALVLGVPNLHYD